MHKGTVIGWHFPGTSESWRWKRQKPELYGPYITTKLIIPWLIWWKFLERKPARTSRLLKPQRAHRDQEPPLTSRSHLLMIDLWHTWWWFDILLCHRNFCITTKEINEDFAKSVIPFTRQIEKLDNAKLVPVVCVLYLVDHFVFYSNMKTNHSCQYVLSPLLFVFVLSPRLDKFCLQHCCLATHSLWSSTLERRGSGNQYW